MVKLLKLFFNDKRKEFKNFYKLTTYFFLESVTVLADTISNVTRCEDFLGDNWVGIWVPDILDQEPKEIN